VCIGPALVLDDDGYRIPRCHVTAEDAAGEWDRLVAACKSVAERIETAKRQTASVSGAADIFAAQLQMLDDPRLQAELKQQILDQQLSAAYACSRVLSHYAQALRRLSSPLLAQRADDVVDIERRLLEELGAVTQQPMDQVVGPVIVLCRNLTPGETANLDTTKVVGFCTESGGPGSHTAIVAKGLGLPAVVGIGDFLSRIDAGTVVIVDGDRGRVVLNPDDATMDRYQQKMDRSRSLKEHLSLLRDKPAETADGVRIQLSANIEFPHEVEACRTQGADGVGLYRTEFLYLHQEGDPSEEDQYSAYRQVAAALDPRPVIIRTLDLGADKMENGSMGEPEPNPFLGLRSIRLSLKNQDLFRKQVRAALRAACHGQVRMMFPLVSTLSELRRARMLVRVVADDLAEEGIDCKQDVPIGIMVEVPSAVLMLDRMIREVDFVSIGTNDLVQYTLAVDRSNAQVAELYQSCDPAVLRLIERAVQIADDHEKPLSVCGEMSSDPGHALLLIGLGVRHLSVPPTAITRLKKAIRSVRMSDCRQVAQRALALDSAQEIEVLLADRLAALAPELVVI
jgi:phosphoenolpyruvate-protein phosphotransferase (PTS system enzyme I)